MNVNNEKCVGCGICVKDCFPKCIELIDEKAKIKDKTKVKLLKR